MMRDIQDTKLVLRINQSELIVGYSELMYSVKRNSMHPGLIIRGALVKHSVTSDIFPLNVHEFQLKEEQELERATMNRLKQASEKKLFVSLLLFSCCPDESVSEGVASRSSSDTGFTIEDSAA